MPLQTPMPFAGEAVTLPITLLTQKRQGGRTRAAPAPEAAIITTAGALAVVGRCGGANVARQLPGSWEPDVMLMLIMSAR